MAREIPDTPFHKKLRRRFDIFLRYYHREVGLPPPTRLQIDIAQTLQYGPKKLVVEAFRGVGKSHITGLFVVWCLLRNPLMNILVVSASKDRSDQFVIFCQGIINNLPGLEYLKAYKGQRNSVVSFDVGPAGIGRQFPSVRAAGITGQITGSRADIIVADDVEVPSNAMTQGMRDRLSERVREFADILKPLEDVRILYLGTPQCEESLYNKLPDRGYTIRVWPSEMPAEADMKTYGDTLAPLILKLGLSPGQPTDPARFPEAELLSKKAEGRSRYAMQYMLSTTLSDADRYPLKVRDILFHPCDPETAPMRFSWGPNQDKVLNDLPNVALSGDKMYPPMRIGEVWADYTGTVMAIDPSGRGADETGYSVVKMLNGYLFVVASGGINGGYDASVLTELATIAKSHSVNTIIVESNFGDGMWLELFKPVLKTIHSCSVEEVSHRTQKERRIIDTIEPVLSTHRLVVDPQVVRTDFETVKAYDAEVRMQKSLFYQLTRITSDRGSLKHDDRLDALAIAVAYWTERLGKDHQKGEMQARKDAILREVARIRAASVNVSDHGHKEPRKKGILRQKRNTRVVLRGGR